jgi:2-desacetyl-2-hydroxyethyl bacteriochlorophyllide A dehydrogenase
MREIVLAAKGEPESLQLREAAEPTPGKGQVAVRVQASGVAFAEVQMLRGRYYNQPEFPFVPGYDLVGEVVAKGPETTTAVGTRVAAMTRTGAWREVVVLDESTVVAVPDALDAPHAVALVTNGVTAWQLLRRANVRKGQTVLVHGASGGVGGLLARLALREGIRVLGTASASKHDALEAAGVEPIDYRAGDVPAAVRALAPEGVNAVFDHLGGQSVVDSYKELAPGGIVLCYGAATTMDEGGHPMKPYLTIMRRIAGWELARLLGPGKGRKVRIYSVQQNEAFRTDLRRVFDLAVRGELTATVAATYPLAKAGEALRTLVDGKVAGKLVLEP